MYRPPDNSKYLHCNFVELLSDMLLNATINVKEEVILTGDLNVNYLKAKDHHEIKAVIASAGLKQLIKKPTRIDGETKTLIAIFATNNPFVKKDTNVIPTSISDHEMIGAVRKLNCKKTQSQTKQCRNYKNYNAENVSNRLKNSDWSGVSSDVNSCWTNMKLLLLGVLNEAAPLISKRIRGRSCPWITPHVKAEMNARDHLLRKHRKSGLPADKAVYKRKRNLVNQLLKK